jgi:membrane associated rhomboid family serine protease
VFPLKDNIPTDRFPVVTVAIIALNVIAYFFWQRGGITFGDPGSAHYLHNLSDYGAFPYEITHPGKHCEIVSQAGQVLCEGEHGVSGSAPSQPPTWLTPFTAMFMHGGLLHLGGNMLFLWIFGNNLEDSMGPVRYVIFYLVAGLCALGLQVAVDPSSTAPTLGASGAIAGVLGGYIVLYPRARVLTLIFIILFFTIIEIPAVVVLAIWFGEQLLFGATSLANPAGGGGGVAYFAHIGGFIFGLAAIRAFASHVKATPPRYPVY